MKKHLLIIILLLITPTLVTAKTNYLYDVLKNAAESNNLAKEYTGEHHDSFTKEPTHKIYHWYAENDNEGNQVLEKNNVIFADHCWQMIRTTDTGGVKLLYNGESENGQCSTIRGTHVGYYKNSIQKLTSNYWYGTDYIYDKSNSSFKLSGETIQETWNQNTSENLIGKYTCKSTDLDNSCQTLYYVVSYNTATNAYTIDLNSNSHYSQFGILPVNLYSNSPTYVGYKYGDLYRYNEMTPKKQMNYEKTQEMLIQIGISTNYWYADSVTCNTSMGLCKLNDPYKVSSREEFSTLVGKYTFNAESSGVRSPSVYYIAYYNDNSAYARNLDSRDDFDNFTPIKFGKYLVDNGDGTFTLEDVESVPLTDWYTNYNNYKNMYTCNNSQTTCTNPRYVTTTSNTNYKYIEAGEKIVIAKNRTGTNLEDTLLIRKDELILNSNNYNNYKYTCNTNSDNCTEETLKMINNFTTKGYYFYQNNYFGSGIEWDGEKYSLTDIKDLETYLDNNVITSHHYICLNAGEKTCNQVAYIFYDTGSKLRYILLENGETSIDKVINNMLTKNNHDSIIKIGIEEWYKKRLLEYDDFIEDIVYCNDRSIDELGGWGPNGIINTANSNLRFKNNTNTTDLKCSNITDQFSVSNNRAKTNYKVGLLTNPELFLLNNNTIRKTSAKYWLMSANMFSSTSSIEASNRVVDTGGFLSNNSSNSDSYGIRPTISLIPKTRYSSGNGSTEAPYIIDLNKYYGIDVEINNETEDLTVEIEDLSQVEEGETVNFKVTPIKGHKVTSIRIVDENDNEIDYTTTDNKNYTFTMPSSDVTIIPSYERVKNTVNVEDNKNTKEFVIEVNDSTAVVYEDTVRFKVEPEEGYEVEKIDITDEQNNKIDYKKTNNINEYEFTMPDTSVLIKPKYRLITSNNSNLPNPNTKRQIVLIIISIIILGVLTIIFIKKKKRLN